jgi:hypothetical protein
MHIKIAEEPTKIDRKRTFGHPVRGGDIGER